jgi:hypothetical protein
VVRKTCQLSYRSEDGSIYCDKPAVDFIIRDEKKFWLCAEHFDLLMRIRQIIKEDGED